MIDLKIIYQKKILVIFLLFLLLININPIKNLLTKKFLELFISHLTKFETQIGNVDYQIFKGNLSINDFKILNTSEYKYLYAVSVSNINIKKIDLLQSNISLLEINNGILYLEEENGITNLKKLFTNIKNNLDISNTNSYNSKENQKKLKEIKRKSNITESFNNILIKTTSINNTQLIIINNSIPKKQLTIPLENYFNSSKKIRTLTQLLNSYITSTIKKIKETNKLEDLSAIFPEWENRINKIKKEMLKFKEFK